MLVDKHYDFVHHTDAELNSNVKGIMFSSSHLRRQTYAY